MVLTVIDCHPIFINNVFYVFKKAKRRNILDPIDEYSFFLLPKIQFLYKKFSPEKKKKVTVG